MQTTDRRYHCTQIAHIGSGIGSRTEVLRQDHHMYAFSKEFHQTQYHADHSDGSHGSQGVLAGETPRLIDEWQKAPDIWNHVKDNLDFDYRFGKFILTGSSTPADKTVVHHSGAGRIVPVKMRPMSLWESRESKGTVSLADLFAGGEHFPFDPNSDFSLAEVAHLICRGG